MEWWVRYFLTSKGTNRTSKLEHDFFFIPCYLLLTGQIWYYYNNIVKLISKILILDFFTLVEIRCVIAFLLK